MAIVNGFHVLNVACQGLYFTPGKGIFMQINNKTFEKFITMNLVREIFSCCSISGFLIARFYTFLRLFFLQDCEADMKYIVVMDIHFFIYNELRG